MADYEASIDIDGAEADVFAYLSDIDHLPAYFERMTSAEPGDGDEVRVSADLGDREVEGEAWFKVDDDAHALTWGSEGPNDYHGRLEVSGGSHGCTVTVTLSTERAAGPEIQDGLEQTLENVKRLTEPG